jgi:glucokinase
VHARIGLDIGGTKTAAGVVLFPDARIVRQRIIPTRPDRDGDAVLQDVLDLAASLIDEAASLGFAVEGIGAGVAELVSADGKVTSAQTIAWRGLPVREHLSRLAPAIVESDVRAAALGEALHGAGRGYDCFVYVTVGTGISHSLVQGGRPFAGAHGNALVLASGPTSHTCERCGAKSVMVLEEFASGPGIARRYAERVGRDDVTGRDVVGAADDGDNEALEIVTSAAEALGASIGFLINVLDPEAVVVGGGLGLCGSHYWRSLVESTRAHTWADAGRGIPVVMAGLGVDAGIVGAAACWHPDLPELEECS